MLQLFKLLRIQQLRAKHDPMMQNMEIENMLDINPTSGGLRRGKEVEGGGQFDPPYLKALKSHSKVAK